MSFMLIVSNLDHIIHNSAMIRKLLQSEAHCKLQCTFWLISFNAGLRVIQHHAKLFGFFLSSVLFNTVFT